MIPSSTKALAALLIPLAVAACSREGQVQKGVATPAFSAAKERVPLGSPLEVTYKFVVAGDAPAFDQDYRVLVHFMDADEEMMWTDDHAPPTPTSQWKPGQTYEYSRTVFIPIYPYVGRTTVRMGLYSLKDQSRVPLEGTDAGQRSYRVATLELVPQSENIFLIYKEGWHRAETAAENPATEWQWTQRDAVISFRNPKRDALLYLHLDGRPELVGGTQQVSVLVNGQPAGTVTLADRDEHIEKIPLTAAQLGTEDLVELRLQIDKTFVPSAVPGSTSGDSRELGVRVFNAFVEAR
jgi:hypothetical protein